MFLVKPQKYNKSWFFLNTQFFRSRVTQRKIQNDELHQTTIFSTVRCPFFYFFQLFSKNTIFERLCGHQMELNGIGLFLLRSRLKDCEFDDYFETKIQAKNQQDAQKTYALKFLYMCFDPHICALIPTYVLKYSHMRFHPHICVLIPTYALYFSHMRFESHIRALLFTYAL